MHLHAGRRQQSMRRADRPDTRKRLTRRPELDKENSRVAGGVHTRRRCSLSVVAPDIHRLRLNSRPILLNHYRPLMACLESVGSLPDTIINSPRMK